MAGPNNNSPDSMVSVDLQSDHEFEEVAGEKTTVDSTLLERLRLADEAEARAANEEEIYEIDDAEIIEEEYDHSSAFQPVSSAPDDFYDQDEEFADEKTQIFMTAVEEGPLRGKLVIVEGKGEPEYNLTRDSVTLGRGTNNDFVIPDISTSRKHFQILRTHNGFRLKDLNSGNGSFLNGSRILEADLRHGDEIEVGSTKFQFEFTGGDLSSINSTPRHFVAHPMGGPPPSATPIPSDIPNYSTGQSGHLSTVTHYQLNESQSSSSGLITVMLVGFGLIFLSLAALVGYKFLKDRNITQQTTQQTSPNANSEEAMGHYINGSRLMREERWEDAHQKFLQALQLDPNFIDAKTNLAKVEQEIRNRGRIEIAQQFLDEGSYHKVLHELKDFPKQSAYYSKATRQLIPKAKMMQSDSLYKDASTNFSNGNTAAAEQLVNQALDLHPGHLQATALKEQLELAKSELAMATNEKTSKRRHKTGERTGRKTRQESKTYSKTKKDKKKSKDDTSNSRVNYKQGFSLYKSGNFDGAAEFFNDIATNGDEKVSSKAKVFEKNIRDFKLSYLAGNSALTSGSTRDAIKHLSLALSIDNKIGGYYSVKVKGYLGEAYYKQANSAFNSKNWVVSAKNAQQSLKYNPKHAGSKELIIKVEEKANAEMVEAMALKDTNPRQARKKCQRIIKMVSRESDIYQRAFKLLKSLPE